MTTTRTKTPAKKASGKNVAGNALLAKRQLRRTRPTFTRHRPDRKAKLKTSWKKPRGLHNKLKDRKNGCGPWLSQGYRTPVALRGSHISGFAIAHVANVAQLEKVNKETTGAVLAAVGAKRQLELLHAAKKSGVRVLNHKMDERIAELEGRFKKATAERAKAKADAEAKTKKAEAKADAKGKKAKQEEKTAEEQQAEQDKIKQEVLTAKGN